jgi:DNA-binding IclR family transcriptional regulator
MTSADQSIPTLTKSQADCLLVLRNPGHSQSKVAIAAKLDLKRAETALRRLEQLGLARQTDSKLWIATALGEDCNFETLPEQRPLRGRPPAPSAQTALTFADAPPAAPQQDRPLGAGARRLLELLDRPKRGPALAQELGFSHERVRQLLHSLHALGRVSFGDPDHPSWLIKRAGDETPVLTREAERALAALPREHLTDATRLAAATGLSDDEAERILGDLIAAGLVEAFNGSQGGLVFRITAAGSEHPQCVSSARRAAPPPLPARSDRVRNVLQTIFDAGALRIRDVKDLTGIPQNSINALMQYLKRKGLVEKAGDRFDAPYGLTERGLATLTEMTRRRAA